jgi:hypothetical protein
VQLIKEYVANGQAVAFSGSVLCGYCNAVPLQDGVIYETDTVPNSGHGQLVVVYDDNVGTPGNAGAFLIQNSFGTSWPPASSGPSPAPPGTVYWSYNTFATTQGVGSSCLPALARPARRHPAFRRPARSAGFDYPVLSMDTGQQSAGDLSDPDTFFPRSGLSHER